MPKAKCSARQGMKSSCSNKLTLPRRRVETNCCVLKFDLHKPLISINTAYTLDLDQHNYRLINKRFLIVVLLVVLCLPAMSHEHCSDKWDLDSLTPKVRGRYSSSSARVLAGKKSICASNHAFVQRQDTNDPLRNLTA